MCICQVHDYHIYFLVCVSSVGGKKTDYVKKKGGSTFEGIYKYVCVCVRGGGGTMLPLCTCFTLSIFLCGKAPWGTGKGGGGGVTCQLPP